MIHGGDGSEMGVGDGLRIGSFTGGLLKANRNWGLEGGGALPCPDNPAGFSVAILPCPDG